MYLVYRSKQYRKSLEKIIKSGKYNLSDISSIDKVIKRIALGKKIDMKYQDHKLKGKMSKYRECHIKSDLLLVYELDKKELVLLTIDIKNHSNLFK
jgi:mRNA interferase YafQ